MRGGLSGCLWGQALFHINLNKSRGRKEGDRELTSLTQPTVHVSQTRDTILELGYDVGAADYLRNGSLVRHDGFGSAAQTKEW